jgi:hypothetical protein
MTDLKPYDITLTTTQNFFGTVNARSCAEAKRLAEVQFKEGSFRQIVEEIATIKVSEVRS